jgi:hypothetical protein
MPKIPQHFLDCSIYLYDCKQSAEEGENFGGSGCLVKVQSSPVYDPASYNRMGIPTRVSTFFPPHIYAVTNRHVVEQDYPVVRLNTVDGKIDVLELRQNDWIPHPEGDDLAVAPIDLPNNRHIYFPIDVRAFVHRHSLPSIGAGDDMFMVGRFISHSGKQRNTPSLRFGSIAMLPFEKVRLEGGYMQEAFLVETRSISGYSGSPVFVYKPAMETTTIPPSPQSPYSGETFSTSIVDLVGDLAFLGIDCGHVLNYDDVLDASGRPHLLGLKVASNTGMAIVIPAWRLYDFLGTQEFVIQRQRKDRQYQEEQETDKQGGERVV